MVRRKFLKSAGLAIPMATIPPSGVIGLYSANNRKITSESNEDVYKEKADYTIHIGTGLVEVSPENIISTTTYNGQFPGPLLRFKQGKYTTVDIYNDTDTPKQFHWHGQFLPVDVDGAAEEGTPYIPNHGMRREVFIPQPSGFRFYHTHLVASNNLNAGQQWTG